MRFSQSLDAGGGGEEEEFGRWLKETSDGDFQDDHGEAKMEEDCAVVRLRMDDFKSH